VGFGAGGIVAMGEEVDIVRMLEAVSGFFARESCGKCVPCREGTRWMLDMVRRIAAGGGRPRDLQVLREVATNIGGRKTLCALGDFAVNPVASALRHFRTDFERYVAEPVRAPEPVAVAAG
jgi:NADH-quinone oxidoreductase subunit F